MIRLRVERRFLSSWRRVGKRGRDAFQKLAKELFAFKALAVAIVDKRQMGTTGPRSKGHRFRDLSRLCDRLYCMPRLAMRALAAGVTAA